MYRWDFDGLARQEFAAMSRMGQTSLTAFMNAAVKVDPIEYQRHPASPPTRPPYFVQCTSASTTKGS